MTNYVDATVSDGASCVYQVTALGSDGVSATTSASTVTAATGLIVPTALTATAVGSDDVELTWTDNSQTATGYTIQRSADGMGFADIGMAETWPYDDTSVSAGTQYFYRMYATGPNNGISAKSTIITVASGTDISATIPSLGIFQGTATTLTTHVLYAAGSVDPVGTGWNIDWGDGTTTTSTDDPGSFSHVYAQPGTFPVVASTNNGSYTTTLSANVVQVRGSLSLSDNTDEYLGSLYFLEPGTTYQLTATAQGDHVLRWIVDWGDGNSQTYDATSSTANQTDYTQTFTHDYTVQGPFTVNVTAVSPDSMLGAQRMFSSYTVPYSFSGDGQIAVEGLGGHAGAADSGITIFGGPYTTTDTYHVNWGDSMSDTIDWDTASGTNAFAYHSYLHDGTYNVTVSNSEGDTDGCYLQVGTNSTPTITPPTDQVVAAGSDVNLTATYSGMAPGSTPVAYVSWNGLTKLMTATDDGTGRRGR